MKQFKCHCCGKVFKTEAGFNKHFCEYMKRFVEIEQNGWYQYWLKFKTIYRVRVKRNTNDEYYSFLHSPFYESFAKFMRHLQSNEIIDYGAFLEYTLKMNIPIKDWCNPMVYRNFVSDYIHNELNSLAIERSKKYLVDNNLNIENITSNRLYFSILSGMINNKYLKSIGVDVSKILDPKQLNDVKDLL